MFDSTKFDFGVFQTALVWIGVLIILSTIIHIIWIIHQNSLMKRNGKSGVLLQVLLEKDAEVSPFEISQLWTAFHSYLPWYKRIGKPQDHFSFEIRSVNQLKGGDKEKKITFNFWVPENMAELVEERLKSTYRYCEVIRMDSDYIPDPEDPDLSFEAAELTLREDSAFSIKQFHDIEVDPLSSILSSLSTVNENEVAIIQVMMRPASYKWNKTSAKTLARYEKTKKKPGKMPEWTNYVGRFLRGFFSIIDEIVHGFSGGRPEDIRVDGPQQSSLDSVNQKYMLEKIQHLGFETQIRFLVGSPLGQDASKGRLRRIMSNFQELNSVHNGFKKNKFTNSTSVHNRMRDRYFNVIKNQDILSTIEIAGFCHLVNKTTTTPGIVYIQNKKQPFPNGIAKEDPFAMAPDETGTLQPVGLDLNARMRHVYISGMTGVGKSTLLENMIINDIERGRGAVVIDPHGELVDVILEKISLRRKDVYILDPSDIANPFGLNLLEISAKDPDRREMEKALVVDAYITVMKRVFGDGAIGPNTDDIFRMSAAAILDSPEGGSLLEMLLMLVNDGYRKTVLPYIKDPIVKNYWGEVFPSLNQNKQFATANLNAPLNKIRRFLANGVISNIICQKKSTIDVAEVINSGGVILARFSRGDVGFENSALLGTMLISKIQIAAMQRVSIPMSLRVPTFLYVDEFQNFVGDSGGAKSFAEILSEARKYRLGLVIAHQFLDQLRQSGGNFLMSAIFNNCGTIITFRVGPTDAKFFADIYYNPRNNTGYQEQDIANIGKFTVIIRIMTKTGIQSHPFTAFPLPPVKANPHANPQLMIDRSRKAIGVPRSLIRNSIEERAQMDTISSNE
ncbi:type IV secretory system conjugative DNA transfer family protein [Bacillus sp. Brlt_9]|uniref:type IV secretory system conjugative DNA transfer family protein n=1 Tax=Bacillus sp. Brlt_9 TaxID=3110916 RepID=UPI003F7CBE00